MSRENPQSTLSEQGEVSNCAVHSWRLLNFCLQTSVLNNRVQNLIWSASVVLHFAFALNTLDWLFLLCKRRLLWVRGYDVWLGFLSIVTSAVVALLINSHLHQPHALIVLLRLSLKNRLNHAGPFELYLGVSVWFRRRQNAKLRVNQFALFSQSGHAFAQVEVLEVRACVRTNKFFFDFALIDALKVAEIYILVNIWILIHYLLWIQQS